MIKSIVVNGKPITISEKHLPNKFGKYEIGYADLCYCAGADAEKKPTITWRAGEYSGTVSPGGVVNMREGMIVNVASTGLA
jgi:hypothetical protein